MLSGRDGGLDEDEADDLVRRLHSPSLLRRPDLGARTLRLHDNMLWHLRHRVRGRIGPSRCKPAYSRAPRFGAVSLSAQGPTPARETLGDTP